MGPNKANEGSEPSVLARLEAVRARTRATQDKMEELLRSVDGVRAELEARLLTTEEQLSKRCHKTEELLKAVQDRVDEVGTAQRTVLNLGEKVAALERTVQDLAQWADKLCSIGQTMQQTMASLEQVTRGLTGAADGVQRGQPRDGSAVAGEDTVEPAFGDSQALAERITDLAQRVELLEERVAKVQGEVKEEMATLMEMMSQEMNRMLASQNELAQTLALSSKDFPYYTFEERHRGSPETVKQMLRPLVNHFARCRRVADLGCGRGEFLELCVEQGIGCYGVDTNEDMVLHCRRLGLEVRQEDVVEHLRRLGDKTLDGIFCSQVVEHLPVRRVSQLLQEACRVLQFGTHMVIVTINPLSLYALARTFYLDPTHVRPLPAETLLFLAEQAGFTQLSVSYLSPFGPDFSLLPVTFPEGDEVGCAIRVNFDRLNHVVFGNQEYALVATK